LKQRTATFCRLETRKACSSLCIYITRIKYEGLEGEGYDASNPIK
jgi:hypothetical protein